MTIDTATNTNTLTEAIATLQAALGKVRVLVAECAGDSLFNNTERDLAAMTFNLVDRLGRSQTPPLDPASAAFYGI